MSLTTAKLCAYELVCVCVFRLEALACMSVKLIEEAQQLAMEQGTDCTFARRHILPCLIPKEEEFALLREKSCKVCQQFVLSLVLCNMGLDILLTVNMEFWGGVSSLQRKSTHYPVFN